MSPVPHPCPAAATKAGTVRDEAEWPGTRNANGDGGLMGNGASRRR